MNSAAPAPLGGRIAHVLSEALDAVATPEVRKTILDRALAVAGYDQIPESGPDVRRFVDQFFRVAVVSTLGEAAAEHVCASLEPIVQMAEMNDGVSEVRPATPKRESGEQPRTQKSRASDHPTEAPAPDTGHVSERPTLQADIPTDPLLVSVPRASRAPALDTLGIVSDLPALELEELPELPHERPNSEAPDFPDVAELAMEPGPVGPVLLCSPLSFVAKALGRALGAGTEIGHAADELALIELLEHNEGPAPVAIVLDCRSESVDVATIAIVAAEQTPAPLLVLWGATPEMQEEVALASDDVRCLPIPRDCDVHELAARCSAAG